MTIYEIREFLMWCSVINMVLMTISFLLLTLTRGWVYKIHSKWFPITEPQFNAIAYSFLRSLLKDLTGCQFFWLSSSYISTGAFSS